MWSDSVTMPNPDCSANRAHSCKTDAAGVPRHDGGGTTHRCSTVHPPSDFRGSVCSYHHVSAVFRRAGRMRDRSVGRLRGIGEGG